MALNSQMREKISKGLTMMASEGLRTVAIGFKKTSTITNLLDRNSKISTDSRRSRKGSIIRDDDIE